MDSSTAGDVEVTVDKLVGGGRGLARQQDGRVLFVDGVLPGERIRVRVQRTRKDFAEARLVDVLAPSADRVDPPCPALAAGCGGCDWQHVRPEAQLAAKAEIVRDAYVRTAKIAEPPVILGGTVGHWGYRTTARMVAHQDGRLGFRARNAHAVVIHDSCAVLDERLAAVTEACRAEPGSEVVIRVGSDGRPVVWAVEGRLLAAPVEVSQGPQASTVHRVGDAELSVSAQSFYQSGDEAAALLVDGVRAAAGDLVSAPDVIDAYGGCGLFSVALGLRSPVVVEGSPSACADARRNLASEQLVGDKQSGEVPGEVPGEVIEMSVEQLPARPASLVIADPPRAGLGPAGVAALVACNPLRIVLVSCDPVAGARDAKLLIAAGYELVSATVFDLFPQTSHVEVVARFDRSGS